MALFDAGSSAYQGGTVTTVATQVFSTSGLTSPRDVTILNQGTATIFLGQSSVTAVTGLILPAGQQATVQGTAATLIYGITAAGSAVTAAGLATTAVVI